MTSRGSPARRSGQGVALRSNFQVSAHHLGQRIRLGERNNDLSIAAETDQRLLNDGSVYGGQPLATTSPHIGRVDASVAHQSAGPARLEAVSYRREDSWLVRPSNLIPATRGRMSVRPLHLKHAEVAFKHGWLCEALPQNCSEFHRHYCELINVDHSIRRRTV